jgi:hypothetical protein
MYMRVRRAIPGMLPRMPIWFWRVSVSQTLIVAHGSGGVRSADSPAAGSQAGGREEREQGAAHLSD